MRKFLTAALAIMFVFSASLALATGRPCPPGQEKKGWKCVDIVVEDDENGTTINNDITNTNTNTNVNTVITDVDVKNSNSNKNINTQIMGQDQTQGQRQTANNEGNHQSIVIKEAKIPVAYNHIAAPVGNVSAELANHETKSTVRTLSSIFKYDDDSYITMSEAKSAAGSAKITIKKAILREATVSLKNLNWKDGQSGVYMGSLTLLTDDATMDQMMARASAEAMKLGATHVIFTEKSAEKLEASKYGFDLGSAGSVAITASGSAVMAPGATLGWSGSESDNKVLPELYVELFHDVSKIVE
jgi:hypothetical protein